MLTRRNVFAILAAMAAGPALGGQTAFRFPSIDGGEINLADHRGKPVLVVNTASLCAFTPQYDALQALWEAYGDRALILAVPSDDFGGQELADNAAVKEFCTLNFSLTLPMTEITQVKGAQAHPFYQWAARQGVRPSWNFHKILLDGEGRLAGEFSSTTRPTSPRITRALDKLLAV